MTEWRVRVGDGEVSAALDRAGSDDSVVFVCAHGAGGNMRDRGVLAVANALRLRGARVIRFNFPYTEARSRRPDPMPKLKETITAVVDRVRAELGPRRLVIGGRSMGGRAASMLAAERFPADGLLLLAYPLHPAGRPDQLRDAHLSSITMPVLCFNGTRDALCTPTLMERALQNVRAPWTMHWLQDADHSFHVLRSSGRTDAEVMQEMGDASERWLRAL